MSRTIEDIEKALDAPIPSASVKEREGGGGKNLSYLEGHYVIAQLNKVFGPLNWSSRTEKMQCTFSGEVENRYGKKSHYVSYIAQVRLVIGVPGGNSTEHVMHGFGDGQDSVNPGKAHELAVKEAETDALKRAAKNLGNSMGLELYDKEKNAAREEAKEEPKQAAPKAEDNSKELGTILSLIGTNSSVLIKKGKATLEGLQAEMRTKYNATDKSQLNFNQAKEFLNILKEKQNA